MTTKRKREDVSAAEKLKYLSAAIEDIVSRRNYNPDYKPHTDIFGYACQFSVAPKLKPSDFEEILGMTIEEILISEKLVEKSVEPEIKLVEKSVEPVLDLPDVRKVYECYFDGCCEPRNPGGTMGFGVYIVSEGKEYRNANNRPAHVDNTNNVAEYLGLQMVLGVLQNKTNAIINIFGDSNLVVMQMTGEWQIKDGAYKTYALKAKEMLTELQKRNTVNIRWIPREKNSEADKQSKLHLNNKS